MAEQTPTIAVDNFFGLPATFGVESSEDTEFQQFATRFDANGDYLCSQEYDTGITYNNEAGYCGGASPDIVTHLGDMLSEFGNVASAKLPTRMEFRFEAGVGAKLTIEGHQHSSNPHLVDTLRTYNCASLIPAASGVGVPLLIVVAGDVSPVSASLTLELEHVDKPGADGTHFAAQNVRCHVTLSVDYEGHPSGVTEANWLNVILAKSRPNDDTPTATLSAEQWIDAS